MPELSPERLKEIRARRETMRQHRPQKVDHLTICTACSEERGEITGRQFWPCITYSDLARDGREDAMHLLAEVDRLRAERQRAVDALSDHARTDGEQDLEDGIDTERRLLNVELDAAHAEIDQLKAELAKKENHG